MKLLVVASQFALLLRLSQASPVAQGVNPTPSSNLNSYPVTACDYFLAVATSMVTFVPAHYPDTSLVSGISYTRVTSAGPLGQLSCPHADNTIANPPWPNPEICKMAGNVPHCLQGNTDFMASYTAAATSLWNELPMSAVCGGFTKIRNVGTTCLSYSTTSYSFTQTGKTITAEPLPTTTTTTAPDAATTVPAQPVRRIFRNG